MVFVLSLLQMSNLKHILNYFFHHDFTNDGIERRVYEQMIVSADSDRCDDSLEQLWNECPENGSEWERAYAETCKRISRKTIYFQKRGHKTLLIAASFVLPLLILAASAYLYWASIYNVKSVTLVQQCTGMAQVRKVTLPDGTVVWLAPESSITYPSDFSPKDRVICMNGEVFFDVMKDETRPFIVKTSHLSIEALGTSFNVSAYPDNPKIYATLQTGKIKVNDKDDTRIWALEPDKQLVYDIMTGEADIHESDAAAVSSWRNGLLDFDEVDFIDLVLALEKYFGVTIHVYNSGFNHQRLHVSFNKQDSIDLIFRIIKSMIPSLNYEITEDVVKIY